MADILPFKEAFPLAKGLFPQVGSSELVEIRSAAARPLWNQIQSALASLEPEKVTAIVRFEKQKSGIDTVVAVKLSNRWSISGGWRHGGGDDIVGAQVVFSR